MGILPDMHLYHAHAWFPDASTDGFLELELKGVVSHCGCCEMNPKSSRCS